MDNFPQHSPPNHIWSFFRAGGFDQVQLSSAADLQALPSLDQKLWVALSCPVDGVEFDRRTLELIDSDNDGHIRAAEILGALEFALARLKSADHLLAGEDGFPLEAIDGSRAEGSRLLASAAAVLAQLGKADAGRITIDDACATEEIFANTPFNGDGIITPASTDDNTEREWIVALRDCLGGLADRGGDTGIDGAMVERFDTDARAWQAWRESSPRAEGWFASPRKMEPALELYAGVKEKIEDYFLRCRMAAYDERAAAVMGAAEDRLLALSPGSLPRVCEEIGDLPLAAVSPKPLLNLENGINPAWAARLHRFRREVVVPLLGERTTLAEDDWEKLVELLAPWEGWWQQRVESPVTSLGEERLMAWLGSGMAERLTRLIERDLAVKDEFEAVVDLERLARYSRDLVTLINNFVSFRDFYTGRDRATFQAGTLYLDGRSCELCVSVKDVAKHAVLATLSRVFLVYCDCVRGSEKMTVAAAFTNGDSDQLMVGRNGVFYDRQGNDWDATIVRIIDHPISVRQAFWAPYKRIGKMVGEQIQKMAAARSRAAEERAALAAMNAGKPAGEGAKPQAQQAFDVGKFAGIFAAIGLAAGAIITGLASVVTGFFKLAWWQMPLALAGVLLLISGPSMIIAWFKLRQRNLGPILDANGWAVNARARLNIPFGASLTAIPHLPKGSRQTKIDPYAEKQSPWKVYLLLSIIIVGLFLAWRGGYVKVPSFCRQSPPATTPAK
jgi:hypothetical protein